MGVYWHLLTGGQKDSQPRATHFSDHDYHLNFDHFSDRDYHLKFSDHDYHLKFSDHDYHLNFDHFSDHDYHLKFSDHDYHRNFDHQYNGHHAKIDVTLWVYSDNFKMVMNNTVSRTLSGQMCVG